MREPTIGTSGQDVDDHVGLPGRDGRIDERAGRSLMRETASEREEEEEEEEEKVAVKTKQLSSQALTPTPTPTPTPTDPFPALEITAATPIAPQFDCDHHADSDGCLRTNRHSASSDDASTSSIDSHSSSSAISDPPDLPANAKKPVDAQTSKPRTQSAVRKLSASQMQALTSAPDSLPIAVVPPQRKPSGAEYPMSAGAAEAVSRPSMAEQLQAGLRAVAAANDDTVQPEAAQEVMKEPPRTAADFRRPPPSSRTLSSPPINRRPSSGPPLSTPNTSRRNSFNPLARPAPLNINIPNGHSSVPRKPSMSAKQERPDPAPSPRLPAIPLPPMSLPTHLQLELAGQRPSPLYIHSAHSADAPYESSAVKFERLLNALWLPPYLEQVLFFGVMACLDAWLYTFTILPMRFIIALGVLFRWWGYVVGKEVRWVVGYVWQGTWRLWRRGRSRTMSRTRVDSNLQPSETERSQNHSRENSLGTAQSSTTRHRTASDVTASTLPEHPRLNGNGVFHPPKHPMPRPAHFRHRRTKSMPSNLTSYNKADLLQGAILICSVMAMMNLDASRMYHFIRAQSSMKLYVIYNILEVGDRLLSAIGQDILECLFSSETLSRNSSGRSKVLLPFGMFILSLVYNVVHTWCLFYQVITLNVAVNSYSNSLLTLLISNQFVEIKGSVFKRIEKENLFQLTCSDIVERFQLWIILLIIGMRNVVEVGGISIPGAGSEMDGGAPKAGPIHTTSILPASFTVLPSWILSGEVLSPFLVVIGIEMIVDWIKHAYINKFNNVKPTIYSRMLDVLCKDYYTNAFATPSLTRRLGLPLLPLSCLFIRASIQVYHMFLATHLHPPIPTSTTELSVESSTPSSPAMIAALDHLDTLIRNALGRAVYGYPYESPQAKPFWTFSSDDAIALLTMVVFFFLSWVVLLIVKLLLGMLLLRYSRERYAIMKFKEHAVAAGKVERENFAQSGQRVGPWGAVEIGDERRKWIYEDDPEGLKRMRDRERKTQEKYKNPGDDGFSKVVRYEMVAKRIW